MGQQRFHAIHYGDDVGTRLALNIHNHRRSRIHPGRLPGVFRSVQHGGDILQSHRRAVLVGHNDRLVAGTAQNLVIRGDGVRLAKTVKVALRLIDIGLVERGAQILHAQPVRRQRGRVDANPHRRFLAAAETH